MYANSGYGIQSGWYLVVWVADCVVAVQIVALYVVYVVYVV
jgi:hypothetical protein